MSSLIESLNSPHHVSRIQNFFGLKLIKILDKPPTIDGSSKSTHKSSKPNYYEMSMVEPHQTCLYSRSSQLVYNFFMIMTGLGNEYFYILFLPFLTWNFSDHITYLTTLSWAISMYLGQATKDLIKIKRPITPPVIKLEHRFLKEWGFPSTHAMAATSINLTLVSLLFNKYNGPEFYVLRTVCLVLGLVLSFFICLSRLYLGMHSLLDILVGVLYAGVLTLGFIRCSGMIHNFVTGSLMNGFIVYGLIFAMGLVYPCGNRNREFKSTARSDTFLILGVAGGVVLAISIKYYLSWVELGYLNENEAATILTLSLRFVIGAVCVQTARFMGKKILYMIIYQMCGGLNGSETLKDFINKNFYFDLCFYFFNYTNVSFTASFTCFILFDLLGIY